MKVRSWRVLVILAGMGIGLLLLRQSIRAPQFPTLTHAVYLWQSEWTPEVRQAVERTESVHPHWMAYTAELHASSEGVRADIKRTDWSALQSLSVSPTPVIRMDGSLAAFLAAGREDEVSDTIARIVEKTGLPSVQLDYDCPTSKLNAYRRLLQNLKRRAPRLSLSISALPTWLNDRAFAALAAEVEYYVLQVHCLDRPETIGDSIRLYRSIQKTRDVQKAEAIGVPYFLAFPTYGYELAFDAQGRYRGILTGGSVLDIHSGYTGRLLVADPEEIASDVRYLAKNHPRHCRGVAWFRLPVDGERLNWNWPTLRAVMEGNLPHRAFRAEIRSVSEGLYELWISNTGEENLFEPLVFDNPVKSYPVLACDYMNGYRPDEASNRISGPSPAVGKPLLAAWFRVLPQATVHSVTISIGPAAHRERMTPEGADKSIDREAAERER